MKKLFSSAISVITSLTVISGAAASAASVGELTTTLPESPSLLSNYSDNAYNYGDFLDENNTAVYNAFRNLTEQNADQFIVTLPEPVDVYLSNLPDDFSDSDQEALNTAILENCKPGIDAFRFDVPENCWLDLSKLMLAVADYDIGYEFGHGRKYTLTITALAFEPGYRDSFNSLDEAAEYSEKLMEAVKDFSVEGTTRYEQIKSIHDNISYLTYYDLEARFNDSPLGVFVEPGVVCEGYAEAFKLICDRLDIPCVIVFGNFKEDSLTGHVWNYVQMEDGKWYAVDVTWDDIDGEGGKEVKYQYFLKGAKTMASSHTVVSDYEVTVLNYPELAEEDYDPDTAVETTTSATTTTTTTTSTTTTTTTTTSTATTTTEPEYQKGDLNRDGEVNIADLVYCANAVMGTGKTEYPCDADGSGNTDVFDIIFMRKLIFSK